MTLFQGQNQLNVKRIRKADEGEYHPADYLPVTTKDIPAMQRELIQYITTIKNEYSEKTCIRLFQRSGVYEGVFLPLSGKERSPRFCRRTFRAYVKCREDVRLFQQTVSADLNRDLLLTAAMFHDIGKTKELSAFPANDYTDDGQLLGHIIIGSQMVKERIDAMPGFPKKLESELIHCILAHHGELEYGSPKNRR